MTEFIELTEVDAKKNPLVTVRLSSIDAVKQRGTGTKRQHTTLWISGTWLHVEETAAEIRAALGWENE